MWAFCTRTRRRAKPVPLAHEDDRDHHLVRDADLFAARDLPRPFRQGPHGGGHRPAAASRGVEQHRRHRPHQRAQFHRFEPPGRCGLRRLGQRVGLGRQPPRSLGDEGPDRQPDFGSGEQRRPDQRSGLRTHEPVLQPRHQRHRVHRHRRRGATPAPRPPPSGAGADSGSAITGSSGTTSSSDLLSTFIQQLQAAQSNGAGYGASGTSASTQSQALLFDFKS